eukprot:5835911-Pyramimonas_sp.AAC.1
MAQDPDRLILHLPGSRTELSSHPRLELLLSLRTCPASYPNDAQLSPRTDNHILLARCLNAHGHANAPVKTMPQAKST